MIYVLVLLVVSGIIAYLGDALGTLIGKRRLTVFGLRPRFTALLIAISTGILITLFTLTVAAILSDDVRIALFSVQQLNEERKSLASTKNKLESEVSGLGKERDRLASDVYNLKNQVRIKEQGTVVFRKDEPISATVLKGNKSVDLVMKSITELIKSLIAKAQERELSVREDISLMEQNDDQIEKMALLIASSSEDVVLAAVAKRNIYIGEPLGDVGFIVRPNSLIIKGGQEIATFEIDGSAERGQIAKDLQEFMDEINYEVVKRGMIGNPLTGKFGDLSSESMLSFYDMVNRIKNLGRKLVLVAEVKEDTYAIGPLNVSFRLQEESGEE